jgi:hypothetical protein
MKDQVINQSQLESVLLWLSKSHKLKSVGDTWHHQANYSVAQLPNAKQIW